MPRPHRHRAPRRSTESRKSGSVIKDFGELPLPDSAEACAKELELLSKQQREITKKVADITKLLRQSMQNNDQSTEVINKAETASNVYREVQLERKLSTSDNVKEGDQPAEEGYMSVCEFGGENNMSEQSSPLILALKKLQQHHSHKLGIKTWANDLANWFCVADVDGSRNIEENEFKIMIDKLDLSQDLKTVLKAKFHQIDKDGSDGISLAEFLDFFLKFPMFKRELLLHADNNAPYVYEKNLTNAQHFRMWLYSAVENPGYNLASKLVFCIDVIFTLVPIVILFIEGVRPSVTVDWPKDIFLWIISIFFALKYVCGLVTCKYKSKFIFNIVHTLELASFFFWFLYKAYGYEGSIDPMGFVVFRIVLCVKLHMVFKLEAFKEDFDIFIDTLRLAYTSGEAVTMLLIYTIFFFSLLVYVFERGEYDKIQKKWIRDEEEGASPFSDIYSCIYFTVVTMTTLGYGDLSPQTYIGKLVAMLTVLVGLCCITFLINIVGDCFEDVFREFVLKRSMTMEEEQSKYLEDCVKGVAKRFERKRLGSCLNIIQ